MCPRIMVKVIEQGSHHPSLACSCVPARVLISRHVCTHTPQTKQLNRKTEQKRVLVKFL